MTDYNPYFRFEGWSVNLKSGMRAPNYPVNMGLKGHTYVNQKYAYTTTSRRFGTEKLRYTIQGIKKDDLDLIEAFWETNLIEGYEDFTVIDNRSRLLFEASWNDWKIRWKKRNGGVYDVIVDIEASVPWTLPVLGAYLMTDNNLNSHNKQGDDLSLVDGTLVDFAADANILRLNGYALKLIGNGVTSQLTGATGPIEWKSNIDGSLSMFCQLRVAVAFSRDYAPVQLVNSTGSVEYSITMDNQAVTGIINGDVAGGSVLLLNDEWYDIALTYDAQNEIVYLYSYPSAETSFVDFLNGSTDLTDHINSDVENNATPNSGGYTTLNLLKDDSAGGISSGEIAYLQNVFIFDGHLTPMEFNKIRRLCYLWNNKTTEYPK